MIKFSIDFVKIKERKKVENFLAFLAIVLIFIAVILLINEKSIKQPNEIVLLLAALVVGIVFFTCKCCGIGWYKDVVFGTIDKFRIDKVLMEVLLCFMLFSGASDLKLRNLLRNFKPICLLALGTTIVSSCLFGLIFWLAAKALGLGFSYATCVLIGSIVSPTDPIAATGILNKLGLSEDIITTIEGESLFNDGTGVALFIFVKDLIGDTESSNFFLVMGRELGGAIIVGLVLSAVFFFMMKRTEDPIKLVIISLASVVTCYTVCDKLHFSGVIASVICGIFFTTMMDKYHQEKKKQNKELDPHNWYNDFWHIVDNLLNYILYVLMGISLIYLNMAGWVIIMGIVAIVANFVARFIGVSLSSILVKHNPGDFNNAKFSLLLTWGGLKGGLCLALALSTREFLSDMAFDCAMWAAFSIVLFTTIGQGLTVSKIYKKLK